jgi:hypothetical protein
VDDSVLQRWEVAPQSAVPSVIVGGALITQIAAVDADYDQRYAISTNASGATGGSFAWRKPADGSKH